MKDSETNTLPEPKISEDRSYDKKSAKAVLNELNGKSFAQEIENDKEKSAVYLNRANQAEQTLGKDHEITKQEQAALGVYKRALLLVGSGGLEINGNKQGEKQLGADNNLPASSYLSHGARVMIEIPAGSGDNLANWLSSGDPAKNGMSRTQSQQGAIDEGNIVYNRSAATHDVSIKEKVDNPGEFELKEKKGFAIGFKDFMSNTFLGTKTNHFGVDLAMNAEFGKKDSEGKFVDRPDGDHGHLYIHYNPPKDGKPGSMLIGIEGGSPSSSKHSLTGASDPLSPVDSSKFDDVATKKQIAGEPEYKDTLVPKKYGGMVIKLDQEKLNGIVGLDDKKYGVELAHIKPGKNPQDFQNKLENKDYHKTPEFKESKKPEAEENKKTLKTQAKVQVNDKQRITKQQEEKSKPQQGAKELDQAKKVDVLKRIAKQKEPSIFKKIANIVTFGFAFKKEVAAHKSAVNEYKAEQTKVNEVAAQQEAKSTKVGISSPDLTKNRSRSNSIDSLASTASSIGDSLKTGSQNLDSPKSAPPQNTKSIPKQKSGSSIGGI